uniref:Putative kDa salivary secreted wc protein n=1 Tax=Ixodes ricinus TaxID=34613 RepID=A0A6B0UK78_IXORI
MWLVLFIMIVILPTIVQGVSLEEIEEGRCLNLVREGGRIICILGGHGDYDSFNAGNCSLVCTDTSFSATLPKGVCGNVGMKCDPDVTKTLESWKQKLDEWLDGVKKMACSCS